MSNAEEQATREYVQAALEKHGIPETGTIHVVRKGHEEFHEVEPLDEMFMDDTTVIMVIPKGGEWMDGQCYNKDGYEVFGD